MVEGSEGAGEVEAVHETSDGASVETEEDLQAGAKRRVKFDTVPKPSIWSPRKPIGTDLESEQSSDSNAEQGPSAAVVQFIGAQLRAEQLHTVDEQRRFGTPSQKEPSLIVGMAYFSYRFYFFFA